MSRLLEWAKDVVDDLETGEVILGFGIGVIIFCILLLFAIFFALFGPVVIYILFVLLLCVIAGVLIARSL